jgi:hypothetical protein
MIGYLFILPAVWNQAAGHEEGGVYHIDGICGGPERYPVRNLC